MSRYTIDSKPGIEIVVGWDPPLRSLFAQVSDERPESVVFSGQRCRVRVKSGFVELHVVDVLPAGEARS
jgi:hypothetical protein